MFRFRKKIEKKYGVIQRKEEKCGFFSYFITFLGGINYCIENSLIPVIDMASYTNIFQEENINANSWELFFEQPMGVRIEDIEDFREVQYVDCNSILATKRPNLTMDFMTNEKNIEYWNVICKKYIRLNAETQRHVTKFLDEYLPSEIRDETVGVLCRGTDYTNLRPYGHPVQPDINDVIDKIQEYLDKYNCKYVFVATEDEELCEKLNNVFGDRAIIPNVSRYKNTNNAYLKEIQEEQGNVIMNTRDYLASIVALSKCKILVSGRTSGSIGALVLAEGYQDVFIWNLGKYGIDDWQTLSEALGVNK